MTEENLCSISFQKLFLYLRDSFSSLDLHSKTFSMDYRALLRLLQLNEDSRADFSINVRYRSVSLFQSHLARDALFYGRISTIAHKSFSLRLVSAAWALRAGKLWCSVSFPRPPLDCLLRFIFSIFFIVHVMSRKKLLLQVDEEGT